MRCKKKINNPKTPPVRQDDKVEKNYDKLTVFQKNVILFLSEYEKHNRGALYCDFKFKETEMKFRLVKAG